MSNGRFRMRAFLSILALAWPLCALCGPALVTGKVLDVSGRPVPDGFRVTVSTGRTAATAQTVDGSIWVNLPAAPVYVVAVADVSGVPFFGGKASGTRMVSACGSRLLDLGSIRVTVPAKALPLASVVFAGQAFANGRPVPDGTDVSIGHSRSRLFENVKTSRGQWGLALLDLAGAAGGFRLGDEFVITLRLPNGSLRTVSPATYKLSATDIANRGVCRPVDLTVR